MEGAGVQKFSQRAHMYLVPDTHDLDIENSLFTMVLQLIQKLDLEPSPPEEIQSTLQKCAAERREVCRDILQVNPASGKHTLVSVFYGGSPPQKLATLDFMHELQRASLYCRWVAASLCETEFQQFMQDATKKHPDGSILSHLHMACEDFILSNLGFS